jgi:penicillin-binding protein 2
MRNYIKPKRAAHLIGYLSEINSDELASGKYRGLRSGDYIGKFGVEKSFENYLRGEHGGRQVEVNASGQVIRVLQTVEAEPGFNIYLAIDQELQDKTEELLNGRVGTAIAMDPNNGEVLAMASSPSFDQNAFVNDLTHSEWNALIANTDRPMENKAIQGEYPPASTYKIITAIAGLSEGIVDKNTYIFCSGGYLFGDRVFKDWKKEGHGSVNIVEALAQSCDVYFYQLGQKLGVDKLSWYAKACGLGEITGINLDHEKKGLVPSTFWKKERIGTSWQAGETLSVAIGQGYNLVTPLQMLVCISAVANGEKVYRPTIIKKIESTAGELVYQDNSEEIGPLPVGRQALEIVREGLFKVVNDPGGTAYESRIKGILMAGKTGTAQVIGRSGDETQSDRKLPRHYKPHAWFVAYAPYENPKIAVSVLVEHGEHGSSAAAPIAGEMIKTYLNKE